MSRERFFEDWPTEDEKPSGTRRDRKEPEFTVEDLETDDFYEYKDWNSSDPAFKVLFWGLMIMLVAVIGLGLGLWRTNAEMKLLRTSNEELGQQVMLLATQISETPRATSTTSRPLMKTTEYVVKRGDTLWQIAKTFLGDANRWKEISDLNNLKSLDLAVGMKLLIPVYE
jgi:LysM repeat protein